MLQKTAHKFSLTLVMLFMSLVNFAQDADRKVDVDIDINKGDAATSSAGFLNNPIVWVIGAAVFILLLVALMRGRRS